MYNLIQNMGHARWIVGVAATILVIAGVKHLVTVSAVDEQYVNVPLGRALDIVMASVRPAIEVTDTTNAVWANSTRSLCSVAEMKVLDEKFTKLNGELSRLTGDAITGSAELLPSNRRTEQPYALDRMTLDKEIQRAILESDGEQAFRCDTLLTAMRWLLRKNGDGTNVASIKWRERQLGQSTDHAKGPKIAAASLGDEHHRANDPWSDLPGCILMSDPDGYAAVPPSNDKASAQLCKGAFGNGEPRMVKRTQMPAGTEYIRTALASVAPKEKYVGNTINVLGHDVPQGPHYLSTLDSHEHEIAQQVANCYTGDNDACLAMGVNTERWRNRYESAAVRMAGVLIVDIQSGAIEAAGSAHTRCYSQEYDGPGRDAECVPLPTTPQSKPFALENHALYTSYMPGSLVKPILAMGLLQDPKLATRLHGVERTKFLTEIRRSNTPAFLDRIFCKDTAFKDCQRPARIIDAATMLGFNAHCGDGSDEQCARSGGLTGKQDDRLSFFTGILGHKYDAAGGVFSRIETAFDAASAEKCSSQPGEQAWRRCTARGKDNHLIELESEAWGQGNALATPVGIAQMLTRLGLSANQNKNSIIVNSPHLFKGVVVTHDGKPTEIQVPPTSEKIQIYARDAQLVLAGMAQTHLPQQGQILPGTASSACIQVYGSAAACTALNHIAGKTGTPTFAHDRLTVASRLDTCNAIRDELAKQGKDHWSSLRARWVDCQHQPIKWYAALLKDPEIPLGPWRKAIVVIVDRNWNLDGTIDGTTDTRVDTANSAAELAFQVIKRIAPVKPSSSGINLKTSPLG